MKITPEGWLEAVEEGLPAVTRAPSVRTTGLDSPKPLGIVWHWTGGPALGPAYAAALADEIRTFDPTKDRSASWHVLVAKNGRIIQSVPFTKGSWHVGRPGRIGAKPVKVNGAWDATAWPGTGGKLFGNINRCTVGVELENSGRLVKVGNQFACWPFYVDPHTPESGLDHHYVIPSERAAGPVDGVFYDSFPPAQIAAATRLLQVLAATYGWTRDVSAYSHFQFDPTRREDAGPVWMEQVLPGMLDSVYGKEVG